MDPLQGELGHSDVTRNLFDADTIALQSTKHLREKKINYKKAKTKQKKNIHKHTQKQKAVRRTVKTISASRALYWLNVNSWIKICLRAWKRRFSCIAIWLFETSTRQSLVEQVSNSYAALWLNLEIPNDAFKSNLLKLFLSCEKDFNRTFKYQYKCQRLFPRISPISNLFPK